jgi:2-oxoglutarate ferredoxin oxidoreductase subunit alpha
VVEGEINFKIGGEAGWGIKATGEMLARLWARAGFSVFYYLEYPSLVQGGHNVGQVRVCRGEAASPVYPVDVLVALNRQTVDLHQGEMARGGVILFDGTKFNLDGARLSPDIKAIDVPLGALAKKSGAPALARNTVALGALIGLVGAGDETMSLLAGVIADKFAPKSKEMVLMNQKAAQAGRDYVKANQGQQFDFDGNAEPNRKRLLLNGNTAVALGALAAGCRFYVAYPMTPASSVLHYLAAHGPDYGMVVRQAEDEIGVINEAIGGSLAGARTMCGTSGGGFALMNEGFSLAGMTETPLVVLMVQRPGPATGLPTWTEQGDLLWVLNAGHGEFPRLVLAPGDVEEAFDLTTEAFNLAEKYQTPVVVLSDKHLAESAMTTEMFALDKVTVDRGKLVEDGDLADPALYKRYKVTDDGVSPRVLPGTPRTVVRVNSDEHEESGLSTEKSDIRITMVNKRAAKMKGVMNDIPEPKLYGGDEADLTFVSWGSVKGAVREALSLLERKGVSANHLHLTHLGPFPAAAVGRILEAAERPILVENNASAQLGRLIRERTGFSFSEKLLKYDGRPFYPGEIVREVLG